MSVNVLMSTIPHDLHAGAVSLAIEAYGASACRWYPSAYPLGDSIAFHAKNGHSSLTVQSRGKTFFSDETKPDIFWFRRQGNPTLSSMLHPSDVDFSRKSAQRATEDALTAIAASARLCVNRPQRAVAVERSKALQLTTALRCGLQCPDTLISNCPNEIRAFLDAQPRAIFKSFMFNVWSSALGTATNFTTTVTSEDLPSPEVLRSCPGIFQKHVAKLFEVRVTVMGRWVLAARLDSQGTTDSKVDWRVQGPEIPVEAFALPREVVGKCLALLRRLGLSFGCIDLIVTPEGEFVFLEVNQMGQFLWLETMAPEIPLLDSFTQFLLSGTEDFPGPSSSPRTSFASVREDAQSLLEEDLKQYQFVIPEQNNIICD